MTGSLQVAEWGVLETPIYLTADDGGRARLRRRRGRRGGRRPGGRRRGRRHPGRRRVRRQLAQRGARGAGRGAPTRAARWPTRRGGEVAEGAVGAGTGMMCLGYKGGIGSASRSRRATRPWACSCWRTSARRATCASTACRSGACSDAPPAAAPATGRQLHRRRRHRRAAARRPARARRAPRRSRARAHGLGRPPRQRRDLPRLLDRSAARDRARRRTRSTRSSPRPSTRPRRPSSTRSGRAERVVGREGRVAEALPHDDVVALLADAPAALKRWRVGR